MLSGRAGQGKSTLMRHLFVHLHNSREVTDEQIRPNFTPRLEEFFGEYQDKSLYYQARRFPRNIPEIPDYRRLILVDGLDEMDADRLKFLVKTIVRYPKCVFLLSSRSRYDKDEPSNEHIICQSEIEDLLRDESLNIELQNNTAYIKPMSLDEKSEFFQLLKFYEPGRDYSHLTTLVENDSENLSRPADFLIYRSQNPLTNSEYYVSHIAWLFDREWGKKSKPREKLLNQINGENLFEDAKLDVSKGKLIVSMPDENVVKAFQVLNLLDIDGRRKQKEYFLISPLHQPEVCC